MAGETVEQLVAQARQMRGEAPRVEAGGPVLDTAGTGGDGSRSINLSTLAAIVAAAAGVRVAKQHNGAISSDCGGTELLEAFGVVYDLPPQAAAECLRQTGICFLYAPRYHAGLAKTVGSAANGSASRVNVVVPLCNPAGAEHQVIGVADAEMAPIMAEAARQLGARHCLVLYGKDLHGNGGMDEITCTGSTIVHEVVNGQVNTWTFDPTAHGYRLAPRHAILGGLPEENELISRLLLAGKRSLYSQAVEMNAAAALLAADRVQSIEDGLALARETLGSGAAGRKLEQVIEVSQQLKATAAR
jgi:anthranilate phosphoribosyltransferase